MATGTGSGLLDEQGPQSFFKHEILKEYVPRLAMMATNKTDSRRFVLVDGFAGQGRHKDGSPGSAELMLMAAKNSVINGGNYGEVILCEQVTEYSKRLSDVARSYRRQGLEVGVWNDDIGRRLTDIGELSKNAVLLLFLDPCGVGIPFADLVNFLKKYRKSTWPRTEVILNFNASITRRAGGAVRKGISDHPAALKQDIACGGRWWREVARGAFEDSGGLNWEASANAVAEGYLQRLHDSLGMSCTLFPIRKRSQFQPDYHLIFLTHSAVGLWEFGDAVARARRRWVERIGPTPEEIAGMLFNIEKQNADLEVTLAIDRIKSNVRRCLQLTKAFRVVDKTDAIYDGCYGFAAESDVRKALRQLEKAGEISLPKPAPKSVRNWIVTRLPSAISVDSAP